MILPGGEPESIAAAAACIRAGGLLGLPTETVYGLAANADDDAAVAQIFKAKGRPADHPLIVHVADASAVAHYALTVPVFAAQLMQAFWPGPLTLILPRRPSVANAAAGGNPTIGLRCPSHPVAQALLKALINGGQIPINLQSEKSPGKQLESDPHYLVYGLAAPSANQFGRVSPTTAVHVQSEFVHELLILDGGACSVGIESTIIDCARSAPVLLRPGAITPAQVHAACGFEVRLKEALLVDDAPAPKASGTLESHYAPKAQVRLMSAKDIDTALAMLGSVTGPSVARPAIALYCRTRPKGLSGQVVYRPMPLDAVTAAQHLFAVLREFDDQDVKLIWIESPPEAQDWDGVRDRLQRAAH